MGTDARLVQRNNFRNVTGTMFNKIKTIFHKIHIQPLQLQFQMDLDSQGRHLVRVYRQIEDRQEQIIDLQPLLAYGYREELQTEQGLVIFTLVDNDRQTLLSLKSLNPEVQTDGTLVFEIEPPVLKYLRKKHNVGETSLAKTVVIGEQPMKPTARVRFDPIQGLTIDTGYELDPNAPLLPVDQVKSTRDGQYARLGNVFFPLVKLSAKAQEILHQQVAVIPLQRIPEFFQRDLVLIQKEFNAVLTDLAGRIRVITGPLEPVVKVTKDPQGWLDFNITYTVQGVDLSHELLAMAKKQGEAFIQLEPATWVAVDPHVLDKTESELKELQAVPTETGYRIPISEFASLEEFVAALGGRSELDKAYQEFLDQLSGFEADPNFHLPIVAENYLEQQKVYLRPYQRAGIHWLNWLRSNHLHGVLADDMGLGKTLQSLCALRLAMEETKNTRHSLIVAPKSVLYHWERELNRVFPFIRIYIYHGPGRNKTIFHASLPYIILTTYETISRDMEDLARVPFFYLILDEATRIKNPDAQRTQAIKALNATHRLALSGTPVENRPDELWSLFDFLMRGHLGKHGTFVRMFEESIMAGSQKTSERLGRRIRPFMLRRKKEQVAQDLPEKINMTEWVSLSDEQRRLYGSLQDEVKSLRSALEHGHQVSYTASILPVLTKLKQICDHPALVTGQTRPLYGRSEKFDWIVEKIDEIIAAHEQVLIFSHFLNMLSLFESVLKEKGISYIRIDGSTDRRQPLIDAFNRGRVRVALLSLMAAGHGIDMTAANHVIHADRWWNPAVEDQATDRVHRIGQNRTVFVYQVLTEGTLEEKIDRMLTKKRGMADQIISAAAGSDYRWSREELLELLHPLD